MYKVVGGAEFIESIRAIDDKLKNIRVSSIEIDKKEFAIIYNFICDATIDNELNNKVYSEVEKITPPIFKAITVNIKKIVSDATLVNNEIYKYLNANYPSISLFLKETDVSSGVFGQMVKYKLRLTADGVEYVKKNGALNKLSDYLARKFCSDFAGETEEKEAEESISLLSEEVYASQLERIEHRTIRVSEIGVIDDLTMGDLAIYIEDATQGEVTVCGKITEITEKQTKNGKPFYIIHIDDTTGKIGGVYFTKKTTIQKIKELKVDDEIIARGNVGEYNGKPSFTFEKINRCVFPKDFVKKERYKKKAPLEYKLIFPKQAEIIKVKSVFEEDVSLPKDFVENTYVVFDIETTGLSAVNDNITEIGAVKIVNGKIKEEFNSLIKPDIVIPPNIVALTGITDDLVKDAPKISMVMPDFMKFIDNTILVGHNVNFDLGFIKRYASAEEYDVNNKVLDTMELSKEYVKGLKRNDLHTLADHFGIVFHHHRALADAYATAECLIEIMKIKGQSD